MSKEGNKGNSSRLTLMLIGYLSQKHILRMLDIVDKALGGCESSKNLDLNSLFLELKIINALKCNNLLKN